MVRLTSLKAILEDPKLKHYVVSRGIPICKLEIATAFKNLTQQEKKYAHFISEGSTSLRQL